MVSRSVAKALGLTRGKCRWCNVSVQESSGGWAGEDGCTDPWCCPGAPVRACGQCLGSGFDLDELDRTGERIPCPTCGGNGTLPGPHWPWRHPQPS